MRMHVSRFLTDCQLHFIRRLDARAFTFKCRREKTKCWMLSLPQLLHAGPGDKWVCWWGRANVWLMDIYIIWLSGLQLLWVVKWYLAHSAKWYSSLVTMWYLSRLAKRCLTYLAMWYSSLVAQSYFAHNAKSYIALVLNWYLAHSAKDIHLLSLSDN